ncbi:Beta-peptidyl aminopeptidase BapA, partial [Pseudocercospora fuligena]
MAPRIHDLGYSPGIHPPGPTNSILDVPGVHISQLTIPTTTSSNSKSPNSTACKGLTLISPRPPQSYHAPCAASTFTFNGNGELTGSRQISDWGFINTPIAFTNSLSLGTVFDGIWDWILEQQDSKNWSGRDRSRNYGTPAVGETADWLVNCDVKASRVGRQDVARCFQNLRSGADGGLVKEG